MKALAAGYIIFYFVHIFFPCKMSSTTQHDRHRVHNCMKDSADTEPLLEGLYRYTFATKNYSQHSEREWETDWFFI